MEAVEGDTSTHALIQIIELLLRILLVYPVTTYTDTGAWWWQLALLDPFVQI